MALAKGAEDLFKSEETWQLSLALQGSLPPYEGPPPATKPAPKGHPTQTLVRLAGEEDVQAMMSYVKSCIPLLQKEST